MPEEMEINAHDPVELDSWELSVILDYIVRIRSLKVALDQNDRLASVHPKRDELKALVNAKRALRRVPTPLAEHGEAPAPTAPVVEERALPALYGNHMVIPEDWRPAPQTADWAMHYLHETGVAFDMGWLVAEFITYWRSRARAMANWQQAFRNNILTKHARGIPLAPPRPRTGPGAGNGRVPGERIYDRSAELRRQRLADFDLEARGYRRSDPVGSSPHRPVGPDDRCAPGEDHRGRLPRSGRSSAGGDE